MVTTALTIEKLVYGGDGLSRNEGQVILTPFVLPGEEVAVEVGATRSGVSRAHLVEVNVSSSERTQAPCPYFKHCGGCHYQHATYEAQLKAKQAILTETLQRVGKLQPPPMEAVSGEPWGYRNRTQFHIENRRLGYRERGSHKLCAITECPISSPRINECITVLNEMLQDRRWPRFIRSLEVFTDEEQVQLTILESDQPVAVRFFEWAAERIPGLVTGALHYHGFRVSRNSFFQVNRFLVGEIAEAALHGAEGHTALDLYAGVGLFSLPLAKQFASVTAVESGSGAVRDLQHNAEHAQVSVAAVGASVDEYLENLQTTPDFVLADPPRTGLGKRVVQQLARLRPAAISLVSCDPSTLARDLAALHLAGYTTEKMTLVDLFPQTFHIETVCRLRLQ